MASALDQDLQRLLVRTNDQRRRTGQALHHLYRTLVFWGRHDRVFLDVVRIWSPGGAAIFSTLARTLAGLAPHEADRPLRGYVAEVLERLAADLDRGDQRMATFLRWLESRFPDLTAMMQEEDEESRIHDLALARLLAHTFEPMAGDDREAMVARLRETAAALPAA